MTPGLTAVLMNEALYEGPIPVPKGCGDDAVGGYWSLWSETPYGDLELDEDGRVLDSNGQETYRGCWRSNGSGRNEMYWRMYESYGITIGTPYQYPPPREDIFTGSALLLVVP